MNCSNFLAAQQASLSHLIECRRCLIQEDQLRFGEQNAGKDEALLFAQRQALGPVFNFVQFIRKFAKSYFLEYRREIHGDAYLTGVGVEQHLGQSAERQIRPLRHKRDLALIEPDSAPAKWPDSRDCSE